MQQWCFTLGLSISCAVDVLIVLSMCFYLQTTRTGFKTYVIYILRIEESVVYRKLFLTFLPVHIMVAIRMDHIVDRIMLYTFNNGSITW